MKSQVLLIRVAKGALVVENGPVLFHSLFREVGLRIFVFVAGS